MGGMVVPDISISAVRVMVPSMSSPPSLAKAAALPTEILPVLSAARIVAGSRLTTITKAISRDNARFFM